jgi:hypothetical protein
MLYGLAWTGGLLGFVGQATDTPLLGSVSRASAFVLPSDALWKGASYFLQPAALLEVQRVARVASNPFSGTEPPTAAFVAWAALYAVVAAALAAWAFSRRDL